MSFTDLRMSKYSTAENHLLLNAGFYVFRLYSYIIHLSACIYISVADNIFYKVLLPQAFISKDLTKTAMKLIF